MKLLSTAFMLMARPRLRLLALRMRRHASVAPRGRASLHWRRARRAPAAPSRSTRTAGRLALQWSLELQVRHVQKLGAGMAGRRRMDAGEPAAHFVLQRHRAHVADARDPLVRALAMPSSLQRCELHRHAPRRAELKTHRARPAAGSRSQAGLDNAAGTRRSLAPGPTRALSLLADVPRKTKLTTRRATSLAPNLSPPPALSVRQMQVDMQRRIELVWRRAVSEVEEVAVHRTRAATATAKAASPSQPHVEVATLPSSAPQRMAPALLDPALADRLADDVIRRVERQVRIERERRGL